MEGAGERLPDPEASGRGFARPPGGLWRAAVSAAAAVASGVALLRRVHCGGCSTGSSKRSRRRSGKITCGCSSQAVTHVSAVARRSLM